MAVIVTARVVPRAKVSENNIDDAALKAAKKDSNGRYKKDGFVNLQDRDGKDVTVLKSGWKQDTDGKVVKDTGFKNRFQRHRVAFYTGGAVLGAGALYGGYQMLNGDDKEKPQDPTQAQSMQSYA